MMVIIGLDGQIKKIVMNGGVLSTTNTTISASWGSITGTLSAQTDLQSQLDSKLDLDGGNANTDIDINSYSFNAKSLHVKGTGGAGHLGLKHQSGSITASTSESTLGANSTGNPVWKNDGNAIQNIMLENAIISGATKTKITYDAKGLVTGGADATTADIADSTGKRYVTDAQLTVINNTSGTNSGNETTSTLGVTINGAAAAVPNDTDLVATVDTSVVKKITWTNVKAFLKTYFDSIYQAAGSYLTSANISDTAYGASWDGDTTTAPSKNAIYDKIQTMGGTGTVTDFIFTDGGGFDGTVSTSTTTPTLSIALQANNNFVTDAEKTVIGNTSGTNTGDQTSIVGITGTIAQFNTSCSDADFATLAGAESLTNKKLGSLTTNGFVKTSGSDGTLSVDTSTYLVNTSTAGVGTSPTATQTDTVTHSLGRTPVIIRIYGMSQFTSNAAATPTPVSTGIWCSSGNRCIYQAYNTAAITTTQNAATSTTFAVNIQTGANSFVTGVIQNVGATTFDIAWTETGTAVAKVYMWEAQ